MTRPNQLAAQLNDRVHNDPVTQALIGPLEQAVRNVLTGHLPKLTLTRGETADILGVGLTTVDTMLTDGRLDRITNGRITLASVLRLTGWPLEPAPLAAPLAAIPAGVAS